MNLSTSLFNFYRKIKYVNIFLSVTKKPAKVQEKLLLQIIQKNKDTVFGKEHHFNQIKSVADFQKNVPVMTYERLHHYIQKIKDGEKNILTCDPIIFFSTTSGTMGNPKFIPITQEAIASYARNFQIFFYFTQRDHPKMFDNYLLSVASKAVKGKTVSGIPYGTVSGLIYHTEPFFVKEHYAIPPEVFDIEDYEAKYYCILRFALERSIYFIITPNPATILLLIEKMVMHKHLLIQDIRNGTISRSFKIEPEIREKLQGLVHKNPGKAAVLEMMNRTGKFLPENYWPELQVIICWKEGTLFHYVNQLRNYFSKVAIRDMGLIASEAHCSIPVTDSANAGVLTIDSNFYEFMDPTTKVIVTVGQLELHKEYSLILTNSSGLYRYHLDDIVKIVDWFNKTPVIQFMHRGNNITSITGEKLTEWQVVTAMKHAHVTYPVPFHHYTFFANMQGKGHYDIYLELYGKEKRKTLKQFLRTVDMELMKLNIEYKEKRKSGRLGALQLKIIEEKSYSTLHKAKSIQHGHDAQIKMPVLTDNKAFKEAVNVIDEIKL